MRSLVCCGEIVDGPTGSAIEQTVAFLSVRGIELAAIDSDHSGRVLAVDSSPHIPSPFAPRIGELLAGKIDS